MIFSTHFLVSNEKTESVDLEDPVEFYTIDIKSDNLEYIKIIKDPIEDNITTYELSFINIMKDLVTLLRNDTIETIIIRIGRDSTETIKNYDLLKLHIRPIKIIAGKPNKTNFNNVKVRGVGSNNYALLLDKTIATELITGTSSSTSNATNITLRTPATKSTKEIKSNTTYKSGSTNLRNTDSIY